jgi:hypothetical protein
LDNGNVPWPRKNQFEQLRGEHTLEHYAQVVRGGVKRLGGDTKFEGAVFVQGEFARGSSRTEEMVADL